MSDLQTIIDELKQLDAAATKGPIESSEPDKIGNLYSVMVGVGLRDQEGFSIAEFNSGDTEKTEADAAIFVAMRNNLTALLSAAARAERYREALQRLFDLQNGPPLLRYEAEWNEAMKLAEEILHEVTE